MVSLTKKIFLFFDVIQAYKPNFIIYSNGNLYGASRPFSGWPYITVLGKNCTKTRNPFQLFILNQTWLH